MAEKKKGPNLGIIIDVNKKRKFAAECKLRGLSMNEVLEGDIDRHLLEWNLVYKKPIEKPAPDPPPLAATSEVKKCIVCKDRDAAPGYSTCNKCGGR